MRKRLAALLVLLALIPGLCGQVLAMEQPDPNRRGSVTLRMQFGDKPLKSGSLTMYRVGQIAPAGDHFLPVEPLSREVQSLEDLHNPALALELNTLAAKHGLEPITAPVQEGKCVFADLEPGLYVVSQRPGEETPGFAAIDPFLISLPQWQNNTYAYDLTASPKVPLVPAPTKPTEPTEPTNPDDYLPQTGQLNWPVPVMTVLGLAFFALGWALFFGAKRRTP